MFSHVINTVSIISLRDFLYELFQDLEDFDCDTFREELLFSLDGKLIWSYNTNYCNAGTFVAMLEDGCDDNIKLVHDELQKLVNDGDIDLIDLYN